MIGMAWQRLLTPWVRHHAKVARHRHQGPPMVLVGTHHKTGTVWMRSVFEAVAQERGQHFYGGKRAGLPVGTEVFFEPHSRFDLASLPYRYRGLHLIRDPRDVLISGAHYHLDSKETWLDERRVIFGGRSYREMLGSKKTLADRIRFEMVHSGRRTINDMLAWNYADPDFWDARYEDLIADTGLVLFRRIFAFLGYPEESLDQLCRIAEAKSLFSGQVNKPGHVRSGKPAQWKEVFDRELAREFNARYGSALVRLGYERDDSWCS